MFYAIGAAIFFGFWQDNATAGVIMFAFLITLNNIYIGVNNDLVSYLGNQCFGIIRRVFYARIYYRTLVFVAF
jgi:hypothetical protein